MDEIFLKQYSNKIEYSKNMAFDMNLISFKKIDIVKWNYILLELLN